MKVQTRSIVYRCIEGEPCVDMRKGTFEHVPRREKTFWTLYVNTSNDKSWRSSKCDLLNFPLEIFTYCTTQIERCPMM